MMIYYGTLPPLRSLEKLAWWIGPFPIKSRHVLLGAERFGFNNNVISFLGLFPPDEVFQTRNDFLNRCQTLERIFAPNVNHRLKRHLAH